MKSLRAIPEAARETLLALGDLYFQIGDPTGAEAVFRQFLDMADAQTEPDAIAVAKQRLAEIRCDPTDPEPARKLLAEAQAIWSAHPRRYRESLDNSRIVEARFERETGHPEKAVAILESVIASM